MGGSACALLCHILQRMPAARGDCEGPKLRPQDGEETKRRGAGRLAAGAAAARVAGPGTGDGERRQGRLLELPDPGVIGASRASSHRKSGFTGHRVWGSSPWYDPAQPVSNQVTCAIVIAACPGHAGFLSREVWPDARIIENLQPDC